jgi:hypothetical protein
MDDENSLELEHLWEELLSRRPEKVRTAFASLDENERRAVQAHPEQRLSAQAALEAISQV